MVGSTGSTKPQPKSNTQNTAGNTYDTTCSNERAAYDMRHIRNTACNDSGAMWSRAAPDATAYSGQKVLSYNAK